MNKINHMVIISKAKLIKPKCILIFNYFYYFCTEIISMCRLMLISEDYFKDIEITDDVVSSTEQSNDSENPELLFDSMLSNYTLHFNTGIN